jgi:hypothetical protein
MSTTHKNPVKIPIPAASPIGEKGGTAWTVQDTKLLAWTRANRERMIAALLFYASKSGGNEMGEYHTLANQLSALTGTGGSTMAAGAGGSG